MNTTTLVAFGDELRKIAEEHKDLISGGLADHKKPSDFSKGKLRAGVKVEKEHTDNPQVAQEIAMDHLTEDPEYYEKLKRIEKS